MRAGEHMRVFASCLAILAAVVELSACCGDVLVDPRLFADTGCWPEGGPGDGSIGDAGGDFPVRPPIGGQIDRAGRPMITTMMIGPFAPPQQHDPQRSNYNSSARAQWGSFSQAIRASL